MLYLLQQTFMSLYIYITYYSYYHQGYNSKSETHHINTVPYFTTPAVMAIDKWEELNDAKN